MSKIITTIAIIMLALPAHAQTPDPKTKLPTDKVSGKSTAKVTLIEYASLSCPHCAQFHNQVMPTIKKDYIDTGKVRFIYRDFPLNAPAMIGAQVARCIGKNDDAKYYSTISMLFDKQSDWAATAQFKERLLPLVAPLGMDQKSFDACLADKELETSILASRQTGEKMGVKGTPSFFLNGEAADFHSIEQVKKTLDGVVAGKSVSTQAKEAEAKAMKVGPNDMVLGSDTAKVTIVEYINIGCLHCGAFHTQLVTLLQKDYIDTGRVRIVFRELPMSPSVFYAYMVARCKGKDGYFPAITQLIADSSNWSSSQAFIPPLKASAEKLGITKEAFHACLENKDAETTINNHVTTAREININHSPEVFLNGEKIHTDSPSAIRQEVDKLLGGK